VKINAKFVVKLFYTYKETATSSNDFNNLNFVGQQETITIQYCCMMNFGLPMLSKWTNYKIT